MIKLSSGRKTIFMPGIGIKIARPSVAAVGWWLSGGIPAANCIAAYQAKGAASYAASLVNLANPGTYNAYEGTAPAWNTLTGWTGDGLSTYLKTTIVPNSNYTLVARFSNVTAGTCAGQLKNTTSRYDLIPVSATVRTFRWANGYLNIAGGAIASGVMSIAGPNAYTNGLSSGTVSGTWSDIAGPIWLLARYNYGAPAFFLAGNLLAVAIYNTILSPDQNLVLATAIAAL